MTNICALRVLNFDTLWPQPLWQLCNAAGKSVKFCLRKRVFFGTSPATKTALKLKGISPTQKRLTHEGYFSCRRREPAYTTSIGDGLGFRNFPWFPTFKHIWLVVSTPLKNISQLGWWHSQLNRKIIRMFLSPPTRYFEEDPPFLVTAAVAHRVPAKIITSMLQPGPWVAQSHPSYS